MRTRDRAHGYPNTRALMQDIVIASGAAIHPAGELPSIPNIDVAATIAQILGLPQNGMDGQAARRHPEVTARRIHLPSETR